MLWSLTKGERKAFRLDLSQRLDAEVLVKILDILLKGSSTMESDILLQAKVTSLKKFQYLEQLYEHLLDFTSQDDPDQTLRKRYKLAKKLVDDTRFDAAETIILSALNFTHQVDDLGIFLNFYILANCFPEDRRLNLDAEKFKDIAMQAEDLAVFRRLFFCAEHEKRMPNDPTRQERLNRILREAKARSEANSLNPRAKYLFLKTAVVCHALLLEFKEMIPFQEAMVAHLEVHPALFADFEYVLAYEMVTLVMLHWVLRDKKKFTVTADRLKEKKFASKLAEAERISWWFPFMVVVATGNGDKAAGEAECLQLLELLENPGNLSFKQGYVSQCLYACACFYHASGDHDMLSKVLGKMNRLDKHDFNLRYHLMAKFIQVVHEIDLGNWEDATGALKNLRQSKVPPGLEGFELAAAFLQEVIRRKPFPRTGETQGRLSQLDPEIASRLEELKKAMEGKLIFDYFDLPAWMESKQRNIPLLKLFQERASSVD